MRANKQTNNQKRTQKTQKHTKLKHSSCFVAAAVFAILEEYFTYLGPVCVVSGVLPCLELSVKSVFAVFQGQECGTSFNVLAN